MTIGVGITTCKRGSQLLTVAGAALETFDGPIHVSHDGEPDADVVEWFEQLGVIDRLTFSWAGRGGIAVNRNRVYHKLLDDGYDWLVILEDDVVPTRRGWAELLVGAAEASGQALMSRWPGYGNWPAQMQDGERKRTKVAVPLVLSRDEDGPVVESTVLVPVIWNFWVTATAQAIRRDVFDRVGFYCEDFGLYGHQDTEWQYRLHAAGLVDKAGHPHLCLSATREYFVDIDCASTFDDVHDAALMERNGKRMAEMMREHERLYAP